MTAEEIFKLRRYQPEVVKPLVKIIEYNFGPQEVFIVGIRGEQYDICETLAYNRKCNTNPGLAGSGFGNKEDDPYRVTRIGLLGEMAFSKVFGVPVDCAYKPQGDICDFTIGDNLTVDVKTASRLQQWQANLVAARSESGYWYEHYTKVYVCAYANEDREQRQAIITLVGYANLADFYDHANAVPARFYETRRGKEVDASKKQLNYELKYGMLKGMAQLLEISQAKKEKREINTDLYKATIERVNAKLLGR